MTTLRKRMTEDLTIRNYSPRTIKVYINHVAKFARYFGKSPDRLTREHICEFQRYLVEDKKCSWSQLNQTVCALRFLYRVCLDQATIVEYIPYAKQPKSLPVVLSRGEVYRLLEAARDLKHRTVLMLLYGPGVRISEALALRHSFATHHLRARIGFTAILHTWGQTLMHHPHVHCLVPGGGLCPDGKRWIAARPGFFLPVRVLSRVFRGSCLEELNRLYQQGNPDWPCPVCGQGEMRFVELLPPRRAGPMVA